MDFSHTLLVDRYLRLEVDERMDVRGKVVKPLDEATVRTAELILPAPKTINHLQVQALEERFAAEHERTYGHRASESPIEIVNLRLVVRILTPASKLSWPLKSPQLNFSQDTALVTDIAREQKTVTHRKAYFGQKYGQLDVKVIERGHLSTSPQNGPLIVEEYDATTVVPPAWNARLDEWGNILLVSGV